jgi:hypothetical protein
MPQTRIASNPFALLMDPTAVFAAVERSERLAHLQSRICRPLDRLVPVQADGEVQSVEGASGGADDVSV